jgi:hypothetical protein
MKYPLSNRRSEFLWIAVTALLVGSWATRAHAQENPVDLQAIIKETQQTSQSPSAMTMVWWVPEAFIHAALTTSPDMTEEKREAFLKPLRSYTIIIVIDAKIGAIGGLTYTPGTDLAASVRLKDNAGGLYTPIDNAQINSDTQSFVAIMKPLMANMLGPLGENMNFFVFPRRGKGDTVIADERKEGVFYVEVGKKEFRWRLPLSSVLIPKTCPTCKEIVSGAYKYCPYDGTKLPEITGPQATSKP